MFRCIAFTAAALVVAAPALAHTGHATAGFNHGFAHPIGGYDHILAMVAVGLWAALLGGQARWLLPVTFVLTMAAGGFLGVAGLPVPMVEAGTLASVIALGLAVRLQRPALWGRLCAGDHAAAPERPWRRGAAGAHEDAAAVGRG